MKCPHCGETLPSLSCPKCGAEIPDKSLYCCWCGDSVKVEEGVRAGERETDFSERILCSDGNCIGVINERGVCNICGKPYAPSQKPL